MAEVLRHELDAYEDEFMEKFYTDKKRSMGILASILMCGDLCAYAEDMEIQGLTTKSASELLWPVSQRSLEFEVFDRCGRTLRWPSLPAFYVQYKRWSIGAAEVFPLPIECMQIRKGCISVSDFQYYMLW